MRLNPSAVGAWLACACAFGWPSSLARADPDAGAPAIRGDAPLCEPESSCSFKKPNILLVLDYSSSMSGTRAQPAWFPIGQMNTTRWDAELDATSWILRHENGFFANNARIALSRFAHDPHPDMPATTLLTDMSFPAITDGYALDVPFDNRSGRYFECKGGGIEAAVEVLRRAPPPLAGPSFDVDKIMLTWTRGALRSAHELIDRTRQNHLGERAEEQRDYEVVLMTDGDWTCPNMIGQSCAGENPAPEAARLRRDGVPVHVIAFGDATMQPSLQEIALQGGTGTSIDATSPQGIVDAFSSVLDRIRDSVIVPSCTSKLPRVLVVMDASTSMLNGNAPGQTKWDKARFALAGNPAAPNPADSGYVEPVLRRKIDVGGSSVAVEDVVHLGMVAFSTADQQVLMASFAPCMRDNFAWAMDPATSCVAPGCSDPYAGSPLHWTYQDSDRDRRPRFVRTTHSYVPPCNDTPGSKSCSGQVPTTFTGQGLEFAHKVIRDYKQSSAPFKIDDSTRFVNVLVTDGQTSEGSSDVGAALASMVAEGIDTFVIGFGSDGEIDRDQLQRYAEQGNTKDAIVVDPAQAGGANALADALAGVVASLNIDSCCVLNDCAAEPEPADPHAVCGDGKVEGDERCDDGKDNATYAHCGGRCDGPHLFCGDGRIDPPEVCDDGNRRAGDGCDAECHIDEVVIDEDAGLSGGAGSGPNSPATVTSWSGDEAGRGSSSGTRLPVARDTGPITADASRRKAADGCGCTIPGSGPANRAWALLALLPLFARRSKRRSRRQRN